MMKSKSGWAALLAGGVCAAMTTCSAAEIKPAPARAKADPLLPSIAITEAEKAPVVDGVLDDPCWAKSQESQVFTDEYSFPVKLKTTFKICQKDEVIYLAIRCLYDEKGAKQTGGGVSHDGAVWNGENIEMFMDPDNADTPGYYQLILTPFDITSDAYNNEPRDPELRWEPKYQVKSKWSEKEWTIEYGIPLAAFNFTKTIYENFGLNVHRVDAVYSQVASWSPGHTEGFHFPHKFGEARGLKGATVKTNEPGLFRAPNLRVNDRVIKAQAIPSLVPEKKPELMSGPAVKASGSSAEISFEVNTRTDVAVWIEDGKGEAVRHLAAGMLGANPPAPLKKDSLKQTLSWDYLDDFGKKVPAGAYKARVGVGSKAALDKEIGRDDAPSEITGLAVDAKGFMYTIGGHVDMWTRIMKHDRAGKFVSMLLPPPADVPVEKLQGLNIIDYGPDGQVRFGSKGLAAIMPHMEEPMPQTLMLNSQGQLIFFGGEYQGGPARLYKINADGSLPVDFIGPYIKDINWLVFYDNWARRFHFALDPLDENVVYVSGLKEFHRSEHIPTTSGNLEPMPGHLETYYNAVCRIRWGQDAPLETFLGKRNTHGIEHSDKPGEFFNPQGIAFDKENNLWVCDRLNNRIQIFDHSGKFLRQFPHTGPYEVQISRKTGQSYVMGIDGNAPSNYTGTLTKYAAGSTPKVLARRTLPGSWNYWCTMALDESGSQPELRLVWTGTNDTVSGWQYTSSTHAYRILRVVDKGDSFSEPELLIGKDPPPAYWRIAAGWESDIIWAGGYWFDANTGRLLENRGGTEPVPVRDGRWVLRNGFGDESMSVFPAAWATNPATPALTNWPLVPASLNRAGARGHCVAPLNNDVYVARYYQFSVWRGARAGLEGPDHHVAIDRYTIDGQLVGKRVVYELGGAAHSPVVDIKGNIYVCDNLGRKIGQFYEDDIASNMPAWAPDYHISAADWEQLRGGKTLFAGYRKFALNPLIRSVGVIYKFSPKGGGLLWRAAQGEYKQFWPTTNGPNQLLYPDWGYPSTPMPKRPATHWSSSFIQPDGREGMYPFWTEGVEWEFLGASPANGRYTKGHDCCVCSGIRFCADDFGRTYVPAAHRNTIRMLDTAGNEIMRIGRYGNLDSGPTTRLKEPNIPLRFPTATTLSKRYLYVVEKDIARILRIKMGYEQERAAEVSVK